MNTKTILISAGVVALGASTACQPEVRQEAAMERLTEPVARAAAVIHPTEGNEAGGVVALTRTADGVRIVADLHGLAPGEHGFHIHELGDCRAPDGTSAGGHYNPHDMPHGAPTDARRHVGDLGNITADEEGIAHYDRADSLVVLGGPTSVVGRAVVVHGGRDDLTSQPSGAAGPRVGCGVIGIAAEGAEEGM